jgi:hypothetical protein
LWPFVIGCLAFIGMYAAYGNFSDRGPIARAFYETPKDSFGADVSPQLLKAVPAGVHHANIAQTFTKEGFDCHRSQLLPERQLWTCQRRTLRFNGLPHNEKWVVEFECDSSLAPCTVTKLHAEVRA